MRLIMAKGLKSVVKAQELWEVIRAKEQIRLFDASYMFFSKENPYFNLFTQARIPGSEYFDFGAISDKGNSGYVPSNSTMQLYMQKINLKSLDMPIVIYDRLGTKTAARLWFTLRIFGMNNLSVLDGGLEKWQSEGLPLDTTPIAPIPETILDPLIEGYDFKQSKKYLKEHSYTSAMSDLLSKPSPQTLSRIIDSRPPLRFLGFEDEPGGRKSGHMPGSKNLYYKYCLNQDSTYKSKDELLELFAKYELDLNEDGNIIHLSGIGSSACSNILAFEIAGYKNNVLYDGGWTDWVEKYIIPEPTMSPKDIMQEAYEERMKKIFGNKQGNIYQDVL